MSHLSRYRVHLSAAALLAVLLVFNVVAFGQTSAPATQPTSQPGQAVAPHVLEYWVFAPPLVTILLAILFQQVIPALTIGILVASFMSSTEATGLAGVVEGVTRSVETYLVGTMADTDHIKILIFSLTIGGMVGVVAASGGTAAMVRGISAWARTRQKGQLATWLAGLLVFFDDYANAMVVGPSMRPVTDRLGISRAKLAYIVDSTAAPVASIALITTWVGAEIGNIDTGLDALGARPAFLEGVTGYGAFIASLPYRFYDILALVMVFFIALLGRDFGPMRREENEAVASANRFEAEPEEAIADDLRHGRAWYAVVPVLTLVVVSIGLLVRYGWPEGGFGAVELPANMPAWLQPTAYIFANTDSYNAILYGAFASMLVALLICLVTGACTLAESVSGATDTMSRMFPTFIILVLAWAFSQAMGDLKLGAVAAWYLQGSAFDPTWLPALIFVTACVTAFSTGTSWGTMGILCPAVVTISASVLADLPTADALRIFYAAVGAVLAGAVFGDHCSPISDTTVLSSLATECPLEKHVWTQIPYAVTVALVSIGSGYVLCMQYEVHVGLALLIGVVALLLAVLLLGRRPRSISA